MDEKIIIANVSPKSPSAEAYRVLRTNIQFANIDKTIKSIAITSSGPGEGKSTIIVNLAAAMAQYQKKVLLVDTDLRKPNLHTFFRMDNYKGITNVLTENIESISAIRHTHIDNLDILTSGPIPPNPSELLGSQKLKLLIKELKNLYDIVLFDTPPVGLVTDAAVLSAVTDGVILVCAAGQTTIEYAKAAKASLNKVNANILGVVLNKVAEIAGYHSKMGYYYSYYKDGPFEI